MASEEYMESGEPASLEPVEEQALPDVVYGNSYLHIHDHIWCFDWCISDADHIWCLDEDDILEDDTVEALLSKRSCQDDGSEDKDSDSDNGMVTVVKITHATARRSVQTLQQYFIKQGFIDAHHTDLDKCWCSFEKSSFSNEVDYSGLIFTSVTTYTF